MEPRRSSEAKLDDAVHRFLDEYFKLSDIRERTTEYVNMFTDDARFILGSQPSEGTTGEMRILEASISKDLTEQEITAAMETLWATISWRKHMIRNASPYGNNSGQVEIHGSVDLELLDGQKKTLIFTSRGHLTPVDSEWGYKWDSYQVFIDLAALAE
ncbi:hypothetical protein N0V84_004765 [Fusarium piperis]|uniref:SnoaL-like domain-containing protein n=1 Tax=Fusarium piperis TaxID=1435070 RepID=A0A9W9BPJ7_9HYPO|nr:hypothetical protein N0V84_004765 [Fusarium piperis]